MKVIVIGAGKVGMQVLKELEKYANRNIKVLGFLDDDPKKQGKSIGNYPVLGRLDQSSEILKTHNVKDALIALPLYAHSRLIEISRALQKNYVRVYIIPDLFALSFPAASLDGFGGIPVIDLGMPGIQGSKRDIKRGVGHPIIQNGGWEPRRA